MSSFKRLALLLWAMAIPVTGALAQSSPGFVAGVPLPASQLNIFGISKVDTTNGAAVGLSVTSGTFSGTINGGTISGVTLGTLGGNPIFSGSPTITGNTTFNGATTFNSANTVGNGHSFGFADASGTRLTMLISGNAFQINGTSSTGAPRGAVTFSQRSDTAPWIFTVPIGSNPSIVLGSTNNPLMNFATNISGTYTGSTQACVYCFGNSTDNAILNSSAQALPLVSIDRRFGGAGTFGSRFALLASLTQGGAITGDTSLQQYVVGNFWNATAANAGGTAGLNNGKGQWYPLNPQTLLHSGATFMSLASAWGEGDIAVESGASVEDIIGHDIILLSTHAVAGSRLNVGYLIAAQQGAVGTFMNGWAAGAKGGTWPFQSGATLFGTIPQTTCGTLTQGSQGCQESPELLTAGFDIQYVNTSQQSGYGFRSAGFAIDGTGQGWFGGGLKLGTAATGYSVDVPNAQVVQSVAVATAGTPTISACASGGNYYPPDIVYGTGTPTKGQYQVTHTKVTQAVTCAGGSGGTPGAQTVTGTTGTGTKFQASVTVSGGGAITAVGSITVAGDYTVNPTNANAEPVTGAGLTGATLSIGIGALTVVPLAPEVFSSCPGVGGIATTFGSGAGLTLTPTCAALNTLSLNPTGGSLKGGSGMFTGNASVATTMTSLGPAGSHTTIQEWFTIINASGLVRYIPAY